MPKMVGRPRSDGVWNKIDGALVECGVPADLRDGLRDVLPSDFDAMMVYGSWARGDANTESDLDILIVNGGGFTPVAAGRVSVSDYRIAELTGSSRTLFGYHLQRDGRILFDPNDVLKVVLAAIEAPDPREVLTRVRSLTPVLDVSKADLYQYTEGLTQVARYLLRSTMYALALEAGEPCFSVQQIAEREGDPMLVTILSSHAHVRPEASVENFEELRRRLVAVFGPLDANTYGDLQDLIEGAWETQRELSDFATLALSSGDELPYDELPKVIL